MASGVRNGTAHGGRRSPELLFTRPGIRCTAAAPHGAGNACVVQAGDQALETGQGYRSRADAMAGSLGDSLEDMELDDLARDMTRFEIDALGQLEPEHGFAYSRFLGAAYDLFRRAGSFDADELSGWFSALPLAGNVAQYKRGLLYLLRLGFLALEEHNGLSVYMSPPNQRQAMQALRADETDLSHIPFRAPGQALSMALELVRSGEALTALGDFDEIFLAYGDDLHDAEASAAVIGALNIKAAASQVFDAKNTEAEIKIYREIEEIVAKYSESWSSQNSTSVTEQAAMSFVNMGFRLG